MRKGICPDCGQETVLLRTGICKDCTHRKNGAKARGVEYIPFKDLSEKQQQIVLNRRNGQIKYYNHETKIPDIITNYNVSDDYYKQKALTNKD